MVLGKLDSYMHRIKLDYFLTKYIKINTKWIKGLYVKTETIKLLEESIGSILFDISLSNIFLDLSSQARETKAKINKWDYIKLKSFFTAIETITKTKTQPTEWEKIFAKNISDNWSIPKELIELNIKKQTTQLGNGQRTWIDIFPKTFRRPTDTWKDVHHH